jgi:hypothetical protein
MLSVRWVERSGVFDDAGNELWWVRLNFTAQGTPGPIPDGLFIKNLDSWSRKGSVNRQIHLDHRSVNYISVGGWHVEDFLVPPGTESIRLEFEFTRCSLSLRERALLLARYLPRAASLKVYSRFWKPRGIHYNVGPESVWKKKKVEIPLPDRHEEQPKQI